MNSTQALDYAIRIVTGHRVTTPAAIDYKNEALETLTALREVVVDNDRSLAEERQEALDSRPVVAPYIDVPCIICGGTDRVLEAWQHNDTVRERLCIDCRRAEIRTA